MKPNYKKLFFWSSLGSIAVGTTVALASRARRVQSRPLACRRIPEQCHGVLLWTERFEVEENGTRHYVHDRYYLQPTPFKVWSVLDLNLQSAPAKSGPGGAAIYHVTHVRLLEESPEEERLKDRFYGVVTVVDAEGKPCSANSIARGGILEIKKCYVGGSSNGIESGEMHRSLGRILNYRIDYSAA
jgi:hypothetical protein